MFFHILCYISNRGIMITIDNNYRNFKATLISPEGEKMGIITNIISLDDVRRQIKKEGRGGYSIKYKDHVIKIDREGNLSFWPDDFCYYTDILMELV